MFAISFVSAWVLKFGLAHAVGLQDVVVIFQHHEVGVLAHLNGSLAVVQMQALGRVDGAGVQSVVEGDQSLFHEDAQTLVDVQGGACQTAGGRQMGAAVGVDDDLVAAEQVLAAQATAPFSIAVGI